MSVMKLKPEEYLFIADMYKDNLNMTSEEIYNICRNLNILGLCERYDDLFKEAWKPKEENEKYSMLRTKYKDAEELFNKAEVFEHQIRDWSALQDTTKSLIYNSFSQSKFYVEIYKASHEDFYNKSKESNYKTNAQEDYIKSYEYTMETKKTIAEDYIVSFNDFIRKRLHEHIEEILNKDFLKKVWQPMWNKFTERERKDWIIDISKNIAKEKALIDLGNDANLMKHHMSSLRIETKLNEYIEKVSSIAIDFYYTHFDANGKYFTEELIKEYDNMSTKIGQKSLNEDKIFNDYKAEIDKVLDSDILDDTLNAVKICKTPEIYGKIGLDTNLDMIMTKRHIKYCNEEHNISKEQFYNLPELLKEPAIIMKSMSKDKAVVAILNDIDKNKLPVMAAIEPNGKGTYDFKQIDSNFILSVYGKDNFNNFVNKALNDNKLLFTDQKNINELEKKTGIEIFKEKQVLTKQDILQQ
ncbi:MAG: hypothetical protein J6P02_03460 [Lachnospiraceae bacterium]|nr:hypothetical protein [Lachnospiraceae bacterium]